MGTGQAASAELSEQERKKYSKIWQIDIDKSARRKADRDEAKELLKKANKLNYKTMFNKKLQSGPVQEQESVASSERHVDSEDDEGQWQSDEKRDFEILNQ